MSWGSCPAYGTTEWHHGVCDVCGGCDDATPCAPEDEVEIVTESRGVPARRITFAKRRDSGNGNEQRGPWADVTETLRGAGYHDAAIAAAFGAIVAGKSASFAAGVLHAAQEQISNPALFEALLLEAQQARELQPVKETVDAEAQ